MGIASVTQAEDTLKLCGKKGGETDSNGHAVHSSFQEGSLTTCGELGSHTHPGNLLNISGEEEEEEEREGEGEEKGEGEQKGKSEGKEIETEGPQNGAAETGGNSASHPRENVSALVVFGGMDTCGHIHNDCFLIVPK